MKYSAYESVIYNQIYLVPNDCSYRPVSFFTYSLSNRYSSNPSWLGANDVTMHAQSFMFVKNKLRYLSGFATTSDTFNESDLICTNLLQNL